MNRNRECLFVLRIPIANTFRIALKTKQEQTTKNQTWNEHELLGCGNSDDESEMLPAFLIKWSFSKKPCSVDVFSQNKNLLLIIYLF